MDTVSIIWLIMDLYVYKHVAVGFHLSSQALSLKGSGLRHMRFDVLSEQLIGLIPIRMVFDFLRDGDGLDGFGVGNA